MSRSFVYATVRTTQRSAIYVIRIKDERIGPIEADDIAERMREKMLARGEVAAEVVVVEGAAKETLRLHGPRHAVSRVRDAMFNAAISWQPIDFD